MEVVKKMYSVETSDANLKENLKEFLSKNKFEFKILSNETGWIFEIKLTESGKDAVKKILNNKN